MCDLNVTINLISCHMHETGETEWEQRRYSLLHPLASLCNKDSFYLNHPSLWFIPVHLVYNQQKWFTIVKPFNCIHDSTCRKNVSSFGLGLHNQANLVRLSFPVSGKRLGCFITYLILAVFQQRMINKIFTWKLYILFFVEIFRREMQPYSNISFQVT